MVSTIRTEHWAWCAIEFGTLPRTLRAPRMPLLPSGQVGGTNRLRLIGGDDVQLGAASLRSSTAASTAPSAVDELSAPTSKFLNT